MKVGVHLGWLYFLLVLGRYKFGVLPTKSPPMKISIAFIVWLLSLSGITFSQNVGIGTASPTANLDLNGTLRIRSSFPKKGSVLTSNDAAGNAAWADPVAFRVGGLLNGQNQTIAAGVWTKVNFNTSATYNLGLAYQPFLYQFLVPENGIYHFDVALAFDPNYTAVSQGLRLVVIRNDNTTVLGEQYSSFAMEAGAFNTISMPLERNISGDFKLDAGDVIQVQALVFNPQQLDVSKSGAPLLPTTTRTYFNGHLVARL